ncbi:MAG TPA: nitroreductase family protein [Vicinamibacterales bacterium]|nr:nitroreductase family protein [Vicinamibacterales bacterium]
MSIAKGSSVRKADHPIDSLFIDRWSPRAMSGESIGPADLLTLFEAARWAPSAGNTHPWRILYAHRDTEHWPVFFDLLVERNQVWCRNAAALLVFISRTTNEQTGKPLRTHTYDTGAAWENLALQGTLRGLVVHGMAGFDYARAKAVLGVPDDFTVEAMAAIGRPGRAEDLPEDFRARESPNTRKPVSELVFEGGYKT